ncbi:hypothetical protein [Bacillus sp. B1-b2]|uniref:hypothetical protein n=1 Tax=Bacillus sp. B1-b2 TaxID=2653201 RepID=UPI0012619446|nr:hypothetical protein [Bacillus sp. B1-b2]KAB7673168.1 hypothetical protein F9279_01785 [Bacillus sp. B1-b2]
MITTREEYIKQLRQLLKKQKYSEDICTEYNRHIYDLLEEICQEKACREEEAMKIVLEKLGSPTAIASIYQVISLTPNKSHWMFFLANLCFFISGCLLTVIYHLFPVPIINKLWMALTSSPSILIILYFIYWLFVGYELGKEFGLGAKKILIRTFFFSLIPNVLLMSFIIFRIIPITIFAPLLTPEFILICIVFTVSLYPISFVGFRFGILRSV